MSSLLPILLVLAVDAGVMAPASEAPASEAPPPSGPPPTVSMSCVPNPVKVGQVLVCTLSVTHRADVSVTVTAPPAFRTDPPDTPNAQPDGQLHTVRTLRMQPLEPKESLKVAGLRVIWREATGGEAGIDVPEQTIPITRMLVAEANPEFKVWGTPGSDADAFFENHGPVPYRTMNWPLFMAACAVVGAFLGIGFTLLLRRWLATRRKPAGPPVDPRPAHVIALEALDALSSEAQTTQMEVKVYYSRLSEIIRAYLERRYQFSALEMTSDEIRIEIRNMELDYESTLAIDRFLDETDLVKFAAHLPASGEADTVMLAARGLIQITRESEDGFVAEARS